MEQRISLVTLGVADLKRSLAFYEQLGWRGQEVQGTVFFQAGGQAVVLWSRELLAADCGIADDGNIGFGGIALARQRPLPCGSRPHHRCRAGCGCRSDQTCNGDLLRRLRRVLQGSRRPRLGDRVQPRVHSQQRWRAHAPRTSALLHSYRSTRWRPECAHMRCSAAERWSCSGCPTAAIRTS